MSHLSVEQVKVGRDQPPPGPVHMLIQLCRQSFHAYYSSVMVRILPVKATLWPSGVSSSSPKSCQTSRTSSFVLGKERTLDLEESQDEIYG